MSPTSLELRRPARDRARIRRSPKKARYEREFIDAVLDRGTPGRWDEVRGPLAASVRRLLR